MSFEISFLDAQAAAYATRHVRLPYADVMTRMEAEIEREQQPAVGRAVGSLLQTLAAAAGARRVLEVGCNLGYSALWLASGMTPDGTLDTIEMDEAIAARAEANFRDAGIAERVRVHRGAALDVLPSLAGPYDVIFLDAAKAEYPRYLEHASRALRPGGIVAADNAFWTGKAWREDVDDADTRGVRALARAAFEDAAWATTLFPAEDGVLVAVKRAP